MILKDSMLFHSDAVHVNAETEKWYQKIKWNTFKKVF